MKIPGKIGVLTICIAVIAFCVSGRTADKEPLRSHTEHSTHYYEEYYDEDYEVPAAMITCYSCHYQKERGYAQGSVNCKEPFSTGQIATVKCAGPCGKIFRVLDEPGEFMISRNCVPKCKDIRTNKGYMDCCSSHLCNGAIGTGRYRRRTITLTAIALLCLIHTLTWIWTS